MAPGVGPCSCLGADSGRSPALDACHGDQFRLGDSDLHADNVLLDATHGRGGGCHVAALMMDFGAELWGTGNTPGCRA